LEKEAKTFASAVAESPDSPRQHAQNFFGSFFQKGTASLAANGPTLVRELGRWDLAGLMINSTIGAGILGLPGKIYALVGIWCVPLCLAGGVLAALVAASFAQAGSRFNRTGGAYLFAYEALGPAAGFAVGWLMLVSMSMSFAAVTNLAVSYIGAIWPVLLTPSGRFMGITAMVLGLSIPVYRGVRLSAHAHNGFTLCKLALLGGFVAISLPAIAHHGFSISPLPPVSNIAPALLLLIFAFGGMEATVISCGEMRHPARDIPFALAVGVLAVVALYSMVFAGSMALVPGLAGSARPLFDGAVAALGRAGGACVVVGGAISISGVMFVILFSLPRIVFALAAKNQFPTAFMALHAEFRTPTTAVLACSGLAWVLAVSSSFLFAVQVGVLVRLMMYATVAAASLRLRRLGYCETPAPLQFPGGGAVAWGALALCLAIIAQSTRAEFIGVGVALAPAVLVLAARGASTRRRLARSADPI
jgi:amino acid transporter